jgi:peptide/nickel transport system permease protein
MGIRRIQISVVVILALLVAAALADRLGAYPPNKIALGRPFTGPTATHWLGLDYAGRDVLSRLLHGGRITLSVSIASILLAAAAGLVAGLVAGYAGGVVDTAAMRTADVLLCLPPILVAMAIVAFVGSSAVYLTLIIALVYSPRFQRVVYASVLTVKELNYVEASRALGAAALRILGRQIVPNVMGPVFVQVSLGIGHAILLETGLAFVGLGPAPPAASWGRMVDEGRRHMEAQPLLLLWPSLLIAGSIIAFNVLGDGLRDRLDPKLRHSMGSRQEAGS